LGDRIGGDAVETDSGEKQCDDAEESSEAGDGALLIEGKIDLLLHGANAVEGEIGIELGKLLGEQGLEFAGSWE